MAAPVPNPGSPRTTEPDVAERFIAALDLQRIGEGSGAWVVHVLGVHDDGQDLWIQVAPDAEGVDGFVLRLSPHATVRHALAAMAAPQVARTRPHVVSVMRNVC